jgi:hypothetical protein
MVTAFYFFLAAGIIGRSAVPARHQVVRQRVAAGDSDIRAPSRGGIAWTSGPVSRVSGYPGIREVIPENRAV